MLHRTLHILRQGITDGLHLGAQIYVSVNSQIVCDDAVGEARFGVPMTRDSINWWLSASKPITAVAIAQQWERGRLDLDDRIAQHIPDFARGGKEQITIRHLLTHTGGFRAVSSNSSPELWETIIDQINAARIEPGWIPGEKAGYHIASSWFILAEIVRRCDGRMIDQYAREEIFLPLGMSDSWIGLPHEMFAVYGDRVASTYSTEKHPPDPAHAPLTPDFAALVRPGGNGRGPVRELGLFYEMLMHRGRVGTPQINPTQQKIVPPHEMTLAQEEMTFAPQVSSPPPHETPPAHHETPPAHHETPPAHHETPLAHHETSPAHHDATNSPPVTTTTHTSSQPPHFATQADCTCTLYLDSLGKERSPSVDKGSLRILLPQTVEAITARHRVGMMDHTFKHVIDFGLGFLINSAQYGAETVPYGYGKHASRRTFGHSGNQSSCAFCDPERKLVVAWVCNGTPGEVRHQMRQRAINEAIYEDLDWVRR